MLFNKPGLDSTACFKDSTNTRNNVSDAIDELYNSSGITKELYNGSSSATALGYSVENDSGFIFGLYRQFERWTNRFIKIRKYNNVVAKKSHIYNCKGCQRPLKRIGG